MILAYSTNGLQEQSLDEALATIASYGFQGAEILLDSPHWSGPHSQNSQYLKNIKQTLKTHGLTLTNLNANDCRWLATHEGNSPRLLSQEKFLREQVKNWHLKALEISAELAGPPVSIATGPRPVTLTEIQTRDRLCFHLDSLLKRAEALQVPLSIEFEPDHFINSWQSLKPFLKEFDHFLLGVNFDIGHVACAGENILETFQEALPCIHNIHFEDICDQIHEHLVPGKGNLPLIEFLDQLETSHYAKGLTVELYNHSHRAKEALEETQRFFKKHRPGWLLGID